MVIVIILIIAILLAFFNRIEEPQEERPNNQIGMNIKIDKTNTVYKL